MLAGWEILDVQNIFTIDLLEDRLPNTTTRPKQVIYWPNIMTKGR